MQYSILVPVIVAFIAAIPGVLAYRQATIANKTTASAKRIEIEAGAYARARDLYEAALNQIQEQLESVQEQLTSERDVSNTLRNRVNALEDTVARLRRHLIISGLPEPSIPIDEPST